MVRSCYPGGPRRNRPILPDEDERGPVVGMGMFPAWFRKHAARWRADEATEGFRVKQVFIEGRHISSRLRCHRRATWLARTVSAPAAKALGAVHRPLADGDGASAGLSQADSTTSWVPCRFSWRAC